MSSQPPFDPLEYLALARDLVAESSHEARLRAATSRAYYALFLIIRDWVGVEGQQNVHSKVLQALGSRGQQGVGGRLHRLRRLREAADYQRVPIDPSFQDWQANWHKANEHAIWLVNRLTQLGALSTADSESADSGE